MIWDCFTKLVDKVKRADEAYLLSIYTGAPGIILKPGIDDPQLTENSSCEVPSRIETFLSEAYRLCGDSCEDVKEALELCRGGEVRPFVKRYMQNDGVVFQRADRRITARSSSMLDCAMGVGGPFRAA